MSTEIASSTDNDPWTTKAFATVGDDPTPEAEALSSCAAHSSTSDTVVLVLHSTTCPHRQAKQHQKDAFQLLDSLQISYTALDGADIDCKAARDDLFLLSGLHAVYPQFFVIRNQDQVAFWGDWERFYQAHERGRLVKELVHGERSEKELDETTQLEAAMSEAPLQAPSSDGLNDSSSSEEDIDMLQLESSIEESTSPVDMTTSLSDTDKLLFNQLGNEPSKTRSAEGTGHVSSESSRNTSTDSPSPTTNRGSSNAPSTAGSSVDTTTTPSTRASMASDATTTKSDLTIYGATSFVAQNHVLQYLLQVSLHLPRELHVTLAGRSPSKLQALEAEASRKMDCLTTMNPRAMARCVFDVKVADGSDEEALLDMAKTTRCVLNCAGPFRRYSSLVVAACAKAGTDYVDITGEVSWAGEMRRLYGPVASSTGARIISFCGFDSVPSDLSVFACVEALRAARQKKEGSGSPSNQQEVDIARATVWHYCVGMANGGTIHTMLDIPIKTESLLRPIPYLVDDPLILTHPSVSQGEKWQPTRNRLALGEWWNQLPSFDTVFRLGVSIPFFMAIANAKIVHASSIAMKYGSKFSYRERFLPVGYAFTTHLGPLSIIPALISYVAIMLCFAILKAPVLGAWLADTFAPPGSGMSDDACRRGKTEVYALVESTKRDDDTSDRASCSMIFKGDPGNWATAQCVTESALCLVLDRSKLPPRSQDGFGTPAELLGHALLSRLRSSSVRPVAIKTTVRLKMSGKDWAMH